MSTRWALAGYYLIRDAYDTGAEPNPIGIPGGEYEIPIVIQDRSFDENGQLLYQPPFGFGNTAVVNGAAFPFLYVEPRKYRFRFLNGANHRFFHLELATRPATRAGGNAARVVSARCAHTVSRAAARAAGGLRQSS